MCVHALACAYTQLVLCSRIQSVQPRTFSTAQLSTFLTAQLSTFHGFYRTNNMDRLTSTIPHQIPPFKSVAIQNLLFEKLLVFSPLLSSSQYVGGEKALHDRSLQVFQSKSRVHTSLPLPMLVRDSARWLVWLSGVYSPQRPKAAGMRQVACGPIGRHQPPC
jgi:hypothetical protein